MRIVDDVDIGGTVALTAILGLLIGAVVAGTACWVLARRGPEVEHASPADPASMPEGIDRILDVLPGAAFVVGHDHSVVRASRDAAPLGIVAGARLNLPEVLALVTAVRRDGETREQAIVLRRPPLGAGQMEARVRAAALSPALALVIVEDLSESRRLDAVRRDFVANVSHELKTPVGALSLLAEAVQSASDDPDAVQRFAARMQVESQRLTNLVNDLVDLSRLQSVDPMKSAEPVEIDRVVSEAVDATKLLASAREIDVAVGERSGAVVHGDEPQLVTALRNLIMNAIVYSPAGTRVAVATRSVDGLVEISVKDQGIGIPPDEQSRIFERFYRVDPARSRVTGGTGLGLAIVKHVCANHGGECTVWSVPGEGSTFTLRLPQAPIPEGDLEP